MSISAKVIAHSKSSITGKEIVTYQVSHHRFILAEMNKHRQLSNSYQSSRAVPVDMMNELVKEDCAFPVFFGANKAGMQATEEVESPLSARVQWQLSANIVLDEVAKLQKMGVHKQLANRLSEPFQWTTGIITGSEWNNFFHLRRDKAAQPEFKVLADAMWEAYQESEPEVLQPGEWHTPFIEHERPIMRRGELWYFLPTSPAPLTLEDALRYSAASCAQISFRKLDQSIETLERVWNNCFNGDIPHAVVAEHQASPMFFPSDEGCGWEDGVTHSDKNNDCWSGNFKSFIQYRQLIPNNVCIGE